eukprot:389836-Pleurochrysis_carterae.AAC.1
MGTYVASFSGTTGSLLISAEGAKSPAVGRRGDHPREQAAHYPDLLPASWQVRPPPGRADSRPSLEIGSGC